MKYKLDERILKIEVNSLFNETIQSFFNEFIPSKKIQHLLIQNKWIRLDGNPCKREDDIVGLNLEINIYPEDYQYLENKHGLDVIYEDELICVVNKPKDVLVHSDGSDEDTLSKWVESYYCDKPYISALPLHRLDKETTGLVVFSKSIIFQPLLDKYLANKSIRRNYLAFVKGMMAKGTSKTINKAIGRDRHNSKKMIISNNGQVATTKIKSIACSKKNDCSIIKCSLDTGRTHQIRIHLASENLPILNDSLYGVSSRLIKRMGLIANELEFYHPLKQEMISVTLDLPNDLASLYYEMI